MSKLVFKSKDNEMIFHPGYLIKNIMDEEGKDTEEMVQLLGLTEKEITSLINAEISITDNMIDRIVKNYGTSKELWKNFQNKYDLKMKELEENSFIFSFERENEISSDIANNILNNFSQRLQVATRR
ncbi:transcriptional regulator [Fusobacterium polymorphum]|uniref:helix-turn-helix transcriptional regulator n=1 Tax=Fusobacterium nucleatum subsp. polymorphum TaxID=76857 RepID=UPI0030CAC1DD